MTLSEKTERQRRKREDELLLLLLLLDDEGRRDTVAAIRHGFSVNTVLNNTFNRAIPIISGAMADAHLDSFKRLERVSGKDIEPPNAETLTAIYRKPATEAAQAMAKSLNDAVTSAQNDNPGMPIKTVVRNAFDEAGYTKSNSYALDLGVERAIVTASNSGMMDAANNHGNAIGQEIGIYHDSTMDNRTTEICIDRNTLLLRASHPYWTSGGIPQLHWRCRSVLLPVFPPYVESDWLPTVPVMPGFGYGPLPVWA